jgi:hypothetical protein
MRRTTKRRRQQLNKEAQDEDDKEFGTEERLRKVIQP